MGKFSLSKILEYVFSGKVSTATVKQYFKTKDVLSLAHPCLKQVTKYNFSKFVMNQIKLICILKSYLSYLGTVQFI